MKLITGEEPIPQELRGGVIAIGNFDGVHRGHQEILALARKTASDIGAPLGVMTFEPHPRTFFRPDQPVFRLTPGEFKAQLLSACGVDFVCVLEFNAGLAGQEA
ncbi:MAG: bifunctional riboflavin kinase/FAD synthetase, partial [Hyphomicrobiales bacterium]